MNRVSVVGDVPELEFVEMVMENMSGDKVSLAVPFLEVARIAMIEKRDFHREVVRECEETVESIDRLLDAATKICEFPETQGADQAARQEDQEPVQVDMSPPRCGNATANDIIHCKKLRHALAPIARRNGGVLEVGGATELIMAVMKPKGNSTNVKSSLAKYIRSKRSLGTSRERSIPTPGVGSPSRRGSAQRHGRRADRRWAYSASCVAAHTSCVSNAECRRSASIWALLRCLGEGNIHASNVTDPTRQNSLWTTI